MTGKTLNRFTAACAHKPALDIRPLMTGEQARELERVFGTLANTTRLRIIHALKRDPGIHVALLARRLTMKPQAVSNQLRRLMDQGIVEARRKGNTVHYTIANPCVLGLIDLGWCLAEGD